jgi:branched-chain amino acid transport system substrate-binding protein
MLQSVTGIRRVAVLCALLLASSTAIAACGGDDNGGSGGSSGGSGSSKLPATIPITAVLDLTGPVAYVGKEEQRGMNLAVEEVNNSKMLGNSKLELTYKDTGSDQATATTQMSQAAKSDAAVILGPLLSNEALATAPIAQREKVVDVATQSQNDGLLKTGDYIYRLTTSQLKYNNLIVNHLGEKGIKKVKLVYANDNPTLVEVATKMFPEGLDKLGISVDDNIGIPTATTDFSALVSKLTSGNPDAIGLLLVGTPIPSLTKALRTAGYKGLLFADSAATAGVLAPAGKDGDGVVYAVDYTQDLDFPSSQKFVKAYKAKYPKLTPYGYNASGYDAVKFIALAIKASGDASRDGILKGAQTVASGKGFDGAVGPAKFTDPDHRDIAAPGALVEWRNGRENLLKAGDPNQIVQPVNGG